MKRRSQFLAIFLCLASLFAFGVGEGYVRWRGVRDVDGTFQFGDRPIPPYALPVRKARTMLERYGRSSSSYLIHDRELGWTHRPNGSTEDRLHIFNAAGLRAGREYERSVGEGIFRVSFFGDSFMLGSDVDVLQSSATQLETSLRRRGVTAEVVNFGVGGYGFDQAYLRYRRDGSQYQTSVIVQGLQLENIGRNVSLFRIVAVPGTVIPFSKPRYLLREGRMEIINQPTVPPERVTATLANFPDWPLARHEASYEERYRRRWYSSSMLISTVVELWKIRKGAQSTEASERYAVGGDGMDITVRVLEMWRDEAARSGTPFVLVYLPRAETIIAGMKRKPDPWQPHLDRLRGFTIVDPSPQMIRYAREHGVPALIPRHYSADGYGIVAEALADALEPLARRGRASR